MLKDCSWVCLLDDTTVFGFLIISHWARVIHTLTPSHPIAFFILMPYVYMYITCMKGAMFMSPFNVKCRLAVNVNPHLSYFSSIRVLTEINF